MCILFLHVNPEPKEGDYRLVVAANRDEYYRRPAAPADKDELTNIIGGKDLEHNREGGMWLGFATKEHNGKSKKHCFAALCNITGAITENATGRGFIVKDYFKSQEDFPQYVNNLENKNKFHGYNLIAVELSKDDVTTYHHGNIPRVDSIYSGYQTLAFGNSPTFTPLYKVMVGRNQFEELLEKDLKGDHLVEALLKLLKDRTSHGPDPELQKRNPPVADLLSSIFIQIESQGYGTRTHTIVLVDYNWNLEFIEHTLKEPIDIKNPKWIVSKIKAHL